jgi:hypothetical protein
MAPIDDFDLDKPISKICESFQRRLNRHRMRSDKGQTARRTIMAAPWLERFAEARFKPADGDFVFRAPGIGPHHYLVNATQKAEIQRSLAARRAFDRNAILTGVVVAVFLAFNWWLERVHAGFWPGFFGAFVLLWVGSLVGQYADFKRIGPALAGARYTEKRITWRERTETLVRLWPISTIIAAGVAGALVAIGGALALLNVPGGSGLGSIFWPSPNMLGFWWGIAVLCAFGAGYCFYLAALKLLRGQRPQTIGAGSLEGPETRA